MINQSFPELEVGQIKTSRGRTLTETDVVNFCMLTGNWLEIHSNKEFAASALYGQRIKMHRVRRNHRQDQLSVLRQWFDAHASDPYPSPEEKAIDLCNSGILAARSELLFPLLTQVGNDNGKGEYYLTDINLFHCACSSSNGLSHHLFRKVCFRCLSSTTTNLESSSQFR